MNAAAAYGLLAHAVVVGAIAALLPFGPYRPRAALVATTIALLVGIAPMLHGIFGTPSLTLLQLAILQIAGREPSPFSQRAAGGLLAFAIPFYAASIGFGPFDPYALGYQPWALLAALVPLAAALWWKRLDTWLIILAVDLAGYASGVFANLWDVLFDPLLFLLAAIMVIARQVGRFNASRRR